MSSDLNHVPTWVDLSVPDVAAAKELYGSLLGWTFQDQGPDMGHYNIALVDGEPVAGLMQTQGDEPAVWTPYFDTDDIDASVEAVKRHGGSVMMEPMEIPGNGHMAIAVDPTGAVFGLWQDGEFSATELGAKHGQFAWTECVTKDFDAALPFYIDALGWDAKEMGNEENFRYVTNGAGDAAISGLFDAAGVLDEETPSHWRVYFAVSDTDAAIQRLVEAGGKLLDGPEDTMFGRIATVVDPQGVHFMLVS
ncbi:VOC family protein [Micrococcoides hystricis]|uniref:VOC family protein n=1 Tax=Micrococcoides hystricis TaxID=1572761 RepID=A0ABV6PAW4_9MICC